MLNIVQDSIVINFALTICNTPVIFFSKLKNMIAALYSSRPSGSNSLTLDAIQFGWETIEKVYNQEMEGAEMGRSHKVPGLKYAFVYRDNWTRLNMRPAKIMQVIIYACTCLPKDENDGT